MAARLSKFVKFVLSTIVVLAVASLFPLRSQTAEENSQPVLVDEFASVGECEFGGRLDSF
jgi:hypothetical protein